MLAARYERKVRKLPVLTESGEGAESAALKSATDNTKIATIFIL